MSGGTPGTFSYGTLSSPVTLAANTSYLLVSQEFSGADYWHDVDTIVTTTGVAAVNAGVYGSGPGAWYTASGANHSYVPVSFRY
jgi:hypothetical protein